MQRNIFDFYSAIYDGFMKLFRFYKPELIIKHLELKNKDIILDIGGGTGYIANIISQKCEKVVVLDVSKKMLQKGKRYLNSKLSFCYADALTIPYDDCVFDGVIFIDSLHHIKKLKAALKEAYRVLKDSGRIIILEFYKESFIGKLLLLFENLYLEKVRFFEIEKLEQTCLEAGFKGETKKISKIEYLFTGRK